MKNKSILIILLLCLFFSLCAGFSLASGYSINAGAYAALNQSMSARSGPGNAYADLGRYFESGAEVSVLTAARDSRGNWWIQVEFSHRGKLRRAYISSNCLNIDPGSLPSESSIGSGTVNEECPAYYGPGSKYAALNNPVPAGTGVTIYAYENGFAQVEYNNGSSLTRVWISKNSL